MKNVKLIGIDLGKHTFHVHCQDQFGNALLKKKFSRSTLFTFLANTPACTVVMESCCGAHYMARQITKLGHIAKLITPQFVRPFVKSNKNDFIDAEAICEAASRPNMRFVKPKTEDQQAMLALHRVRESLVRDKVKTTNQMHAFLVEFGISLPKGIAVIRRLSTVLADNDLPEYLVNLLKNLHAHYLYINDRINDIEGEIEGHLKSDETGKNLLTIPSIGPITASLLSSSLGDGKQFSCSRDFSAALGLVPRQYSTGGKPRLMGISKRGDKNIRRLLVQCARVYLIKLENRSGKLANWVKDLLTRRHSNVVVCALANKLARIAWALTVRKVEYVTL